MWEIFSQLKKLKDRNVGKISKHGEESRTFNGTKSQAKANLRFESFGTANAADPRVRKRSNAR